MAWKKWIFTNFNPVFLQIVSPFFVSFNRAKCIFILVLLFSGIKISSAQTWEINGKVIDMLTREPIRNTYITAVNDTAFAFSDNNGKFTINITSKATALKALADGYAAVTIPIRNIQKLTIIFELTNNALNIATQARKEGERPVDWYVQKMIDNKENNNAENNDFFSYHSYEKMEFDLTDISDEVKEKKIMKPFAFMFDTMDTVSTNANPFLPFFFTETISDVYHTKKPKQKREFVQASKSAGVENLTVIQLLKDIYRDITIYDNYINIFGKSYISPVSTEGLKHYTYYITDSTFVDKRWCYKVIFKANRKFDPTFNGEFWFHDSTFAMQRITLYLTKDAMINFVDEFAYVKVFENMNGNKWVPEREQLVVKLANKQEGMSIIGRKSKYYSEIKINEAPHDSVLKGHYYIKFSPDAFDHNNNYWRKNRLEKLTDQEKDIYDLVDTLKSLPAFQVYVGAIVIALTGYAEIGKINYGPWYHLASRNDVEGVRFRFGGRTNDKFSVRWQFEGYGAYGTKDGNFKYMGGIRYTLQRKPFKAIGFQYKNDFVQPGLHEPYFKDEGWIVILFKRNPSDKLTKVISHKAYFDAAIRLGLSMRIQYLRNYYTPLGSISFSYYPDDSHLEAKDDLTVSEIWVNFRYSKEEKFIEKKYKRVSMGSDNPVFQLNYIRGLKAFDGEFNYFKIAARATQKLNLFPFGYMNYQVEAGKVFGTVPYPLLYVHRGNESWVFDYTAYNLMNNYEFVSDMYAGVVAVHHLDGFILRKIPLIRKLDWREIISARVLFGHLSGENKNILVDPSQIAAIHNTPYLEVGAGLENILKLIRVDALWRLTYLDNPGAPRFGARVSLQLLF